MCALVTLLQRLKQDGKIAQAIEAMNSEILQHFSADESSWEELAELCVPLPCPSRPWEEIRLTPFRTVTL
jgi:hypothetical protein